MSIIKNMNPCNIIITGNIEVVLHVSSAADCRAIIYLSFHVCPRVASSGFQVIRVGKRISTKTPIILMSSGCRLSPA